MPRLLATSWIALAACKEIESSPKSSESSPEPTTLDTGDPAASPVTETFVQEEPLVDVLFAIDNSSSMAIHQADLADAAPVFASYFLGAGLDPHLGVITSDPNDGGVLRSADGAQWVDDTTSDAAAVFTDLAAVGTAGTNAEQVLAALLLALEDEKDLANAGFFRDGSSLIVVAICDEDDQTPTITPQEFSDRLLALGQGRPHTTFNAIAPTSGPLAAERLGQAVSATGGAAIPIDDDWTLLLEDLAYEKLGGEFCLAATPDPASVAVTVDGVDAAWTLAGDCVELAEVPVPGSEIAVTYVPAP